MNYIKLQSEFDSFQIVDSSSVDSTVAGLLSAAGHAVNYNKDLIVRIANFMIRS